MKNLKPIKGKYYIAELVAQGEHEHQDFKYSISDAPKIARSISAFANNDGGRLLIGVKDNGVIAGVRNEEDIYVVEQAAQKYCRPPQDVVFTGFLAEGGAVVIRAEIPCAAKRPVMCRDADGKMKAYFRVADENIPASALMVKAWRAKSSRSDCGLFTSDDAALIALIDNRVGLTLNEAIKRLHISLASAEQSVVKLYAMGMIDFAYIGGEFRIISGADE